MVKFLFLILLLCAETANSQTLSGVDWETATPEQIQKLIDDGASVTDDSLLVVAGSNSNPAVVEALIKAKADVTARDISGKTAFDYAEDNPKIKGTSVYWKLNDLMYK